MYYRLVKCATTIAYASLIWLTWLFFDGGLDWRLSVGCLVLGALWLNLTRVQMRHLLKTYFDVLSRLEFVVPMTLGVLLCSIALICSAHALLKACAVIQLAGWLYLYFLYRRNRARYSVQGHGPVPRDTWISPPAAALVEGDLILTSGRVAARLHESVGHGEMVVRCPKGAMMAFSSYMNHGLVLNPLAEVTGKTATQGHYIVVRLRQRLSEEQIRALGKIAVEMHGENSCWKEAINRQRSGLVDRLPLPATLKEPLRQRLMVDGYDWPGLFMGRLSSHRWTCVGACIELYHRAGVKTNPYGTGLLGFGTTLFDPIMPVRFLSDPAFRLLTLKDKSDWLEKSKVEAMS